MISSPAENVITGDASAQVLCPYATTGSEEGGMYEYAAIP